MLIYYRFLIVFRNFYIKIFIFLVFLYNFSLIAQVQIQNLRYNYTSTQMRIVLDLSHDVKPKLDYDQNNRIITLVFNKANIVNSLPVLLENPFITNYTVILEAKDTKFNFFLKKDVSIRSFNLKRKGILSERYVLDLEDTPSLRSHNYNHQALVPKKSKYVLVLDAGHGGKDPGAIGIYGSYEKNISLAIVKRLAKALSRHPNFEVILTRKEDYYLDLASRVDLANQTDADLFLSIHVDSSKNSLAAGSSTYVLSEKCVQEELRKLFPVSTTDPYEKYGTKSLVSSVVLQFRVESYMNQSYQAAELISKYLSKITKSNKLVKSSEFHVLRSLKVPSVLVEIDFISNPEREILLNTSKYQKKIAKAIYAGIMEYFGF